MSDGTPVIEVERLTRCYGERTAVDDVSFTVGRGEVVGFLGPNGAGKSTTMRVLTGYLPATSGSVRISGCDVVEESREARRRVGYLPEQVPLYPELRVAEYLRYRGRLKELGGSRLRERVAAVMQQCALIDRARSLIGSLSKGYRQRVGLADALLHEPDLLVLDEPVSGLDPAARRDFLSELVEQVIERGTTVVFSTHILSDLERVAFHMAFLARGRIVLQAPLDELLERSRRLIGTAEQLQPLLAGATVLHRQAEAGQPREQLLVRYATAQAVPVAGAGALVEPVTLEDLYLGLTT